MLSQRVKVRRSHQGLGWWNRSRWHWLGCLGQHGPPRQWGEQGLRLLGEAGRQHPRGDPQAWGGGHRAHGGQRPVGAQPYLAGMPESWAVTSLSPGGSVSHPRSGSLEHGVQREAKKGLYSELRLEGWSQRPGVWGAWPGLAGSARESHHLLMGNGLSEQSRRGSCRPRTASRASGSILETGEALVLMALLLGATPAACAGRTGVGGWVGLVYRAGGTSCRRNPLGRWEGWVGGPSLDEWQVKRSRETWGMRWSVFQIL